MQRMLTWTVWATLAALSCGCYGARVHTVKVQPVALRPVAREATREELLDKYNAIAQGQKTINATIELKTTAGSKYSGVIDEYHEVKAFLLAARPAQIRMIGQAPVIGKTVFDMSSDNETFRVFIPSKNKFLVGSVKLERTSEKPIENLRPQHLLDALLWQEIRKEEVVLFEEFNDENARYYVLTVLRGGYRTEILRKIWFDRADLSVARVESFAPKGLLVSDVSYADWQLVSATSAGSAPADAAASYPRSIRLQRPHDDYRLDMTITRVSLNEDIPAERFALDQPAGAELVRVTDATEEKRP
jgi:outer membrane lipoprotein-sorting protein